MILLHTQITGCIYQAFVSLLIVELIEVNLLHFLHFGKNVGLVIKLLKSCVMQLD